MHGFWLKAFGIAECQIALSQDERFASAFREANCESFHAFGIAECGIALSQDDGLASA